MFYVFVNNHYSQQYLILLRLFIATTMALLVGTTVSRAEEVVSKTMPVLGTERVAEIDLARGIRSFGATGQVFHVRKGRPGQEMRFRLEHEDTALLQPKSIHLLRLDGKAKRWELVSESRYDPEAEIVAANIPGPGVYTAVGASRIQEVYDIQRTLCTERAAGRRVQPICTQILCPPDGFSLIADELGPDIPPGIEPDILGPAMGGICEQCLEGPGGVLDFPECGLPAVVKPPERLPPGLVFPWPRRFLCYDATDGCKPGPYKVGQVDYDFEDEFDLIPAGSTTPAYPDVDVRATLRYPAVASGTGQPVAGVRKYPLVVFLHGNHATCPCSCDHSCAPADRIANHEGYNYLLDILASQGFVAVSIDGFDVTCAWSTSMSDYEGRGRLVLRHLEKWREWNANSTDPWGGLFHNRINMNRIGLSGHSRGGEGVVAAEYINRMEGLGFQIRAVNAIAPTDQDPYINYVPEVPYFLLMAASDGDVSNLQGLRTYDRTSPADAAVQSEKSMLWTHGANHNFFNTAWTPGSGYACASDDGNGEGRLSPELQRLVACQSIVPFFKLHVGNSWGYRKLFRGEVVSEGLDGIEMFWSYQHPTRLEVDNFESGDDPITNSLGGTVTASAGFSEFNEYDFESSGSDLYNGSFRHFTHGLVLGWNSAQSLQTTLPPAERNVAGYRALSMRVAQILDGGALNPLDTPTTFRVGLRTGSGILSNVNFDVADVQSVPYPYEYNGGKTVLTTLRVPLKSFRHENAALPLDDIEAVVLEYQGSGLIALDDIQFTR